MVTVSLSIDVPEGVSPAEAASMAREGTMARFAQVTGGKFPDVVATVPEEIEAAEQEASDHLFGLELANPVPEGWTPLEALVMVRCLTEPDDSGSPPTAVHWSPTRGLPSWEADGMLSFVKHQIRLCWGQLAFVGQEEQDDDGTGEPE